MRVRLRLRDLTQWVKMRTSSLGVHLFIWVFGVILLAFAGYSFLSIRVTAREWNLSVSAGAERFSDLIQQSTHYSMLLNRKEDVHHVIRTIAEADGVESVRIYDKAGVTIYSAVEEEIGRRVDLDAEACVHCHRGEEPLDPVTSGERVRIFRRPDGTRVLGLINPIENAPECSQAACHAHDPEQSVLGVLDITMSMAGPDASLAAARRYAVIAAVATALLAALLSATFIFVLVRRPVKTLIGGAEKVAAGQLDTEIPVKNGTEIGQLAIAFNRMTRDLKQARQQLTAWSQKLESRLHEKVSELEQTQRQVVHMEKMASLGKLAATVAHELNNPLAGILNYAKLVQRTLKESDSSLPELGDLERYLRLIQQEAGRSGTIVRNLLAFSRRSGGDFAPRHLNPILERAAMLVHHHTEMSEIHLELRPLVGDDRLDCDSDQIEQALVALMVNAIEAMPRGGLLTVSAARADDAVEIRVADTGVGISAEDVSHIFEPFYSSKADSGAGLGLAVVFGIVQRHGGRIDVDTKLGKGTTFRMVLPRRPPAAAAREELAAARADSGGQTWETRTWKRKRQA